MRGTVRERETSQAIKTIQHEEPDKKPFCASVAGLSGEKER